MVVTVDGVIRNGALELEQPPAGLKDGRVRVAIEEMSSESLPPRYLPYGKYAPGGDSTLEDFKIAEWHGEPEFDADFPVR
jgi:hypothetical protein